MKWIFLVGLGFTCVNFAHAQAVCSRSAITVLRKGPGPKFDKSWVVPKYMPFMKVDLKNGWIKLQDLEGQTHYGRPGDFTASIRCVVIKVNSAETRQGPGTSFPYGDFRTLDRYTPLKRLNVDNGWVEVENDIGLKSWVAESKVWHPVKVMGVKF